MADQELLVVVRMRDEASEVLNRATAALKSHGQAYDDLVAKISSFRSASSAAAANATSLGLASKSAGSNLSALSGPMKSAMGHAGKLGMAFDVLKEVFLEMVDNTVKYEKSQEALSNALRMSSNAIGMTKTQINEIIDRQAKATLTDDTEVRNAAAQLITYGRATKESFKEALEVSERLSDVLGTDLVSASRLVAKVMADPVRGMEKMREIVVNLTDADKERVRQIEASQGPAAAQAEAMKILSERLGSAGSAGEGLSGSLKNLKHGWGELLDSFNDSILSNLTSKLFNVTAYILRTGASLFDWSKAFKESRQLASEGKSRGAKDWIMGTPAQQRDAALVGHEQRLQELLLQRDRLLEMDKAAGGKLFTAGEIDGPDGLSRQIIQLQELIQKIKAEIADAAKEARALHPGIVDRKVANADVAIPAREIIAAYETTLEPANQYIGQKKDEANVLGQNAEATALVRNGWEQVNETLGEVSACQTDLNLKAIELTEGTTQATTALGAFLKGIRDETGKNQEKARAGIFMTPENALRAKYREEYLKKASDQGIVPQGQELERLDKEIDGRIAAEAHTVRIKEVVTGAKDTIKGFLNDVRTGLKEGATLWEAFGKAARTALDKVIEKLSNSIFDKLASGLVDWMFDGGSKGAGASSGSWISQAITWITSFFADGGIMTSRGPVPLRKYSGGGIATSPQLAMFGEGSVPEAYVPVPSGRIPVELRGGGMRGGMTVQTNISVNMAAPADGQGSGGGNGRGGNMMEQARELGAIVTAMVNKNLQDQMRPGGLLNPSGSFSAGVVQ